MLEHETDMADRDAVAARLENLSALWQDATDEERLQFASGLIEAVWVDLDAKKVLGIHPAGEYQP